MNMSPKDVPQRLSNSPYQQKDGVVIVMECLEISMSVLEIKIDKS